MNLKEIERDRGNHCRKENVDWLISRVKELEEREKVCYQLHIDVDLKEENTKLKAELEEARIEMNRLCDKIVELKEENRKLMILVKEIMGEK